MNRLGQKNKGLGRIFLILLLGVGTMQTTQSFADSLFSVLSHPSWENAKALKSIEAGNLEEAEAALLRARMSQPDNPELIYNLGIVKFHKRQYEQAAHEFAEAAAMSDGGLQASALHNQGNCWYQSREWDKAIKSYTDSLGLREDPLTRFNLEQAKKRLKQQMQEMADQDNQKGNESQQGKENNQSKEDQQGKQGEQGQQGQQNQNGQKDGDGGKQDQKPSDNQQAQGQNEASGSSPLSQNPPSTASETASQPSQIASGPASLPESLGSGTPSFAETPEGTRDLQMSSDSARLPPDASDRARQIKAGSVNPYLVDRILRQMEEREKEIQQRLRRDPKREEELENMDPFFMSPDQLRQFLDRRQGKQKKPPSDQPDW